MNIAFFVYGITLLFCCFFFIYFKWYIKRRTSAGELLAEYRNEVYRLIAEIDSATDRDSLLVEDRIKNLKALLDDTDKRIAVYVRELDRSRTGEALYASLGRGIRAALKTPEQPAPPPVQSAPVQPERQPIRAQIEALSIQGLSPGEIASRLDISLSEVDLALNLLAGPGAPSH